MGNLNNLKHKELYYWYCEQQEPKPKRTTFSARVLKYGCTKEKALENRNLLEEARLKHRKNEVKENGKVCNKCGIFKEWSEYSINRYSSYGYTASCKECRNKKKAERRERTNRMMDRKYRLNRRKLDIGDQIYFQDDIREVLDYKYKKGYTVKSILNGEERRISTGDNYYIKNTTCVRFVRLFHRLNVKTNEELELERQLEEERAVNSELFN